LNFEVIRLGGNIGAEIRGLDLRQAIPDDIFQDLHAAFCHHQVLVFRGQDITLEQQMAFGRRFGELSIHPFSPNLDEHREVIVLDYSESNPPALTDQWHADETFRAAPPLATILRSKAIPAYGGDTCFASMSAAYQGLSQRMQQYIHGLTAIHDFKPFRRLFTSSEVHQRQLRRLEQEFPNPAHPLVRVHPVTGRRILYCNAQFVTHIPGLKEEEGQMILNYLYSRAAIPEYQLRVKWEPDMVVMWDNRSTQHYAPHDYYPQRRTMNRVTIAGDPVIGVTGPYTPEEGVEPLPDGHHARVAPAGQRPIREFERHLDHKETT